jgi:predicted HD superfamily hydrolase involved in NAD metabolism
MIEKIEREVESFLSEDRYSHTVGVVKEALKLCDIHGEDFEKAKLASLLHDIGKSKKIDELLKVRDSSDIILKENLEKASALYHSVAGKKIASERYGIEDGDILNAIRYHTTGRPNMSRLEKIVYIADYTEPGRSFEGVEELRAISYRSLDDAMVFALENTIGHVISKGLILHEDTVRARNYLIARSTKIGVKK